MKCKVWNWLFNTIAIPGVELRREGFSTLNKYLITVLKQLIKGILHLLCILCYRGVYEIHITNSLACKKEGGKRGNKNGILTMLLIKRPRLLSRSIELDRNRVFTLRNFVVCVNKFPRFTVCISFTNYYRNSRVKWISTEFWYAGKACFPTLYHFFFPFIMLVYWWNIKMCKSCSLDMISDYICTYKYDKLMFIKKSI